MEIKPFRINREVVEDTSGKKVVLFKGAGRKLKLTVEIYPTEKAAHTYVLQEKGKQHLPGVTAALYSRARTELQRMADASGPIYYIAATTNKGMKAFFQKGAGKDMFPWIEEPKLEEVSHGQLAWSRRALIHPKMHRR